MTWLVRIGRIGAGRAEGNLLGEFLSGFFPGRDSILVLGRGLGGHDLTV